MILKKVFYLLIVFTIELQEYLISGIVNGIESDINDFPFLVSVQHRGVHRCGASIINETTLVTAAHCLQSDIIVEKLKIRMGTTNSDSGGILVNVKGYLNHPDYNIIQNCDIALIWLEKSLNFSKTISPIRLPKENEFIQSGSLATVIGWGRLKSNGDYPEKFHKLDIPILNRTTCIKKGAYQYYRITNKMICAGYMDVGKDACKSDSGGPLILNNTLVGIVSFGDGCGRKNRPGVYTKVAVFRKWIDQNMN